MMLGVFGDARLPLAPDVPAFKELGFEVTLVSGGVIVAPRPSSGFDARTIQALADLPGKVLRSEWLRKKCHAGAIPIGQH